MGIPAVEETPESPLLSKMEQNIVQKVTGKFLYLGRAIDSTLLTPLSVLASQQAAPTQRTMQHVKQSLDCTASQENAVLKYHASDMILAAHIDAGYYSELGARSRAGGHFCMPNNAVVPPNNGSIHNVVQIIKAVISSVAKVKFGALFINARETVHIRNILEEIGHLHLLTPIRTDNSKE